MPDFVTLGDSQFSDGPDHLRGNRACTDMHAGDRNISLDWCCCCDPCRYTRPPANEVQRHCCRCVPRLICARFTPDESGNDACCKVVQLPMIAGFYASGPGQAFYRIEYSGEIGGVDYALTISEEDDGLCYWRAFVDGNLSAHIAIDHINVTCLSVPEISITGVTDTSGCTGTISFSNYLADKLPFHHVVPETTGIEMVIPTWTTSEEAQCNCESVPKFLCVDGVRHVDGDREQVQFVWDEALGDRWTYCPICLTAAECQVLSLKEHIYLRGDSYGNCYLEFDFEQTGPWTNDWASPQNTLGDDIHEIRDGMVAIESCGCDIHAHSYSMDRTRFVNINAGDCGCWKYHCAKCRCVPHTLCVIGEIDGEQVTGEAHWDGDGWQFSAAGYVPAFTIKIGPDECDNCVLSVVGDFSVDFQSSTSVSCGEFLSGEVVNEIDPYNLATNNWLWLSSSVCSECEVAACGICAQTRCGGPPKIVYFDLEARTNFVPLPPGWVYEYCNLSMELHFFQRWIPTPPARIQCGYVGYKVVTCPATAYEDEENFVIRVTIADDGFGQPIWQMDRANLDGNPLAYATVFSPAVWPPIGSSPASCDPFLYFKDWNNGSVACLWGCADISVEFRTTFAE